MSIDRVVAETFSNRLGSFSSLYADSARREFSGIPSIGRHGHEGGDLLQVASGQEVGDEIGRHRTFCVDSGLHDSLLQLRGIDRVSFRIEVEVTNRVGVSSSRVAGIVLGIENELNWQHMLEEPVCEVVLSSRAIEVAHILATVEQAKGRDAIHGLRGSELLVHSDIDGNNIKRSLRHKEGKFKS